MYTYYVLHIFNYFIKVFFDTKLSINKLVTNHQQIAMFLFFISDYWTTVLKGQNNKQPSRPMCWSKSESTVIVYNIHVTDTISRIVNNRTISNKFFDNNIIFKTDYIIIIIKRRRRILLIYSGIILLSRDGETIMVFLSCGHWITADDAFAHNTKINII